MLVLVARAGDGGMPKRADQWAAGHVASFSFARAVCADATSATCSARDISSRSRLGFEISASMSVIPPSLSRNVRFPFESAPAFSARDGTSLDVRPQGTKVTPCRIRRAQASF